MEKKGAGAQGASTVVFVLAILILLYVILAPGAHRQQLLGPNPNQGPGGGQLPPDANPRANVLLSETVGRLSPPSPNEVEHSIPGFTIFTEVNAKELARKNVANVKNGVFSTNKDEIRFNYDSSNVKDVKLSFNVKKTSGKLKVLLNGEEVYNSEIQNPSVGPIKLRESLLEEENVIEFKASSPGIAFWNVNVHELNNVIVSGKVTDRSGSFASHHISIPEQEYNAMNSAELKFLPNCNTKTTGRMRITANNQQVFSGMADCGVPNKVEVAKEILKQGDNTLRFVSEKGQYFVDMVSLNTKMKGQDVPVFYFNLPERVYERVRLNDALLFVKLRFAEMKTPKAGTLNINGFESTFRTRRGTYTTQVNPEFLTPGPNSIMVVPQGRPIDVAELKVELR